jgi:YD repeat-containing protein
VAYTYDGAQQLVTETGPNGEPWSFGYDARGQVTSSEDPLGNESTMVYDDFGASGRAGKPDAAGAGIDQQGDGQHSGNCDSCRP